MFAFPNSVTSLHLSYAQPQSMMQFQCSQPDIVPSYQPRQQRQARRSRNESTCQKASTEKLLKSQLPVDFSPTPYSVIIGRDRQGRMSVGNRRLEVIASIFREKYVAATTKDDKSTIVSEILKTVQESCPDNQGAFIRYSNGRWWDVEEVVAREKIGAVMRDSLGTVYRSSTKFKVARRKMRRESMRSQTSQVSFSSAERQQPTPSFGSFDQDDCFAYCSTVSDGEDLVFEVSADIFD